MSQRNPTNWDEYQYGTSPQRSLSQASINSARSVHFDGLDGSPSEASGLLEQGGRREMDQKLRRRRSSISRGFNTLAQVGGVNSIANYASSWQRAAGFLEITPQPPSFVLADQDPDADPIQYGRIETEYGHMPRTSLLHAHLESTSPDEAVEDGDAIESNPTTPRPLNDRDSDAKRLTTDSLQGSVRGRDSIFAIAPHLGTPLAGSYGTSYGTLRSTLNESSMIHAGQLWKQQQATGANAVDGERAPMIVKEVEQDGVKYLVPVGQSTLYQTIFNSTNVLIGVGLLSLPVGLKYAGWVCGISFLFLSAVVTGYTATLISKCMDLDPSLITFADLAFVSFGQKARIAVSLLFSVELLAACVALLVLFGDTLNGLIPSVTVNEWKVLCGLLLIPLNFLPLRLLSITSILGIVSTLSIVIIIFIDGFSKPHTPGSLIEPATTYLFPSNWLTLPLSFGLLMSPWGGHGVFPNIYRDMRHPHKYGKAVKTTFTFTYILDCATAVAGILMFGDGVMDEITANIIGTSGYSTALTGFMCVFIAIIPLTKVPLNARPIVSTIEHFAGLSTQTISDAPALTGLSSYTRGILKIAIKVIVVIMFVIISILFPAFDSIMAFMGSTLCFTICVILPISFHMKLFWAEIGFAERVLNVFLLVVCSIMAVIGTVFAILPKSMIGAE
ncbi:transmembrane amino acid transporter-2 [Coleophoma cylindrospora]|uniref:Transmembrane amino acid transporter-2 n=1 Tax=Coleophoma cylindrospora TaxID=1849047 RepID=A0A3D8ST11_9HELO|nr:transmembrane amino acid transporter-2 [Coleophoma cylindrospora]